LLADFRDAGVQLVLCASSPDTPELLARLEAAVAGRPEIRWINAMLPVPEVVQLQCRAAVSFCPPIYELLALINRAHCAAGGSRVGASRGGGRRDRPAAEPAAWLAALSGRRWLILSAPGAWRPGAGGGGPLPGPHRIGTDGLG
jgi:hypothetical protein